MSESHILFHTVVSAKIRRMFGQIRDEVFKTDISEAIFLWFIVLSKSWPAGRRSGVNRTGVCPEIHYTACLKCIDTQNSIYSTKVKLNDGCFPSDAARQVTVEDLYKSCWLILKVRLPNQWNCNWSQRLAPFEVKRPLVTQRGPAGFHI